jgi:hypothetical protein
MRDKMKNNYFQIVFAILFLTGLQLNAAQADEKIKVKLLQPPPNMLGIKDLWKLDITNTTRENINIYLTGTATESKKGLIVSGKSKVISVSPGKKTYTYDDFKSGEVSWKDRSIQEILLRTGNVPEGEYTICVTAFYENNEVADQESCIEQSIIQQGSITLISPSDGEEIDREAPIAFTWTPLSGVKDYTLHIIEIKGGQSPDAAMKENRLFFEKKGINSTLLQYPISEKKFDAGKKYAWMVSANGINSGVNSFMIIAGGVTATVTLTPFGSECCDSIYVNTNENFFNAFRITSGGVTTNTISSAVGVNSTVNPSTITTPVSSVIWNSVPGGSTFQQGTHCVGSICFTNITGPFTMVVNWSTDGGHTFTGRDTIHVSCPSTPLDSCVFLCNGSFEQIINVAPPATFIQTPQANIPCWKTTETDGKIEIWNGASMSVPAFSGNQFAELNCNGIGTLYQTFNAISGTSVVISFAHRGRYTNPDVMEVSIGLVGSPVVIGTYSANKTVWVPHTVPYTFTSTGLHEIRFKSISSNGGAGPLNGGNFLDSVTISCPSVTPPRDPCCPPWNRDIMMDMLVYHGQGSTNLPYTLNFSPTSALNSQMYNYINYVNIARPTITSIDIWWGLFDPPYTQPSPIGPAAFTWWTATHPPPNSPTYADPNFFTTTPPTISFPMSVTTWYKIRTWIYLNDDQTFFPVDQCGYNDIYVRVHIMPAPAKPVLEFSYDGGTVIKTVPIP